MMHCDLIISAAEPSADLHGAKLTEMLLKLQPQLRIAAIAGPLMRALPVDVLFPMEKLRVMGFLDVAKALPRLVVHFFAIRNAILANQPKAVVCIDYPDFHLALQKSLRKKGYAGKLIHYICPTVWAWRKNRIFRMEKTLDLLLTLFPFEPACFSATSLCARYVGHPLVAQIPFASQKQEGRFFTIFPGSREAEIRKNFPIQLRVVQQLRETVKEKIDVAVSIAHPEFAPLIHSLAQDVSSIEFFYEERKKEYVFATRVALATSGTMTLELALHEIPTVVNFAIHPFDVFLAQNIFRINLPFYCIVNLIAAQSVFPEFFGPHCTVEKIFVAVQKLWGDAEMRLEKKRACQSVRAFLGDKDASREAAASIISLAF